jgi:uroporphyrinogen decarboxylase
MTSRERFFKTVSHQLPDRLPVDLIWPRNETLTALKRHFKTDSLEEVRLRLGIDFRWMGLPAEYPDFRKRVNGTLTGDAPGAGREYIFHDKDTFEDHWGIVHKVGADGKYLEWKDGPLAGKEELGEWHVPAVVYPPIPEITGKIAPFRDFVTVAELDFPFKIAWNICGFEHFLMLMVLNPEMVEALYDRIYGFYTEKAVLAARAGYDVIAMVGDVAGQSGMLFSKDLFERFDVPRFGELVRRVKAVNKEIKIFYHSDGNMEDVIPHLIRIGIDVLNPIQSACMDPAVMKRKYGSNLTFHGTISVQDTLPNGTVEDVRNEVIKRIKTVGYNGGLVISPENSIPYDAPLDNILALYETALCFDYKSLI